MARNGSCVAPAHATNQRHQPPHGASVRLPIPSAVRASVERGDPWAIFRDVNPLRLLASLPDCPSDSALSAARARPAEAHAPQAVTAHPQTLDTETDRDYGDAMVSHDTTEDTFGRGGASFRNSGEGVPAGSLRDAPGKAAHHFDRLAFLARVQRIDP